MPIQARVLDRVVIVGTVLAAPGEEGDESDEHYAYQHVQSVQAGHRPIEEEKDLHVLRVRSGELKVGTGELLLDPVAVILDTLDPHEHATEEHGDDEECDQRFSLSDLCG